MRSLGFLVALVATLSGIYCASSRPARELAVRCAAAHGARSKYVLIHNKCRRGTKRLSRTTNAPCQQPSGLGPGRSARGAALQLDSDPRCHETPRAQALPSPRTRTLRRPRCGSTSSMSSQPRIRSWPKERCGPELLVRALHKAHTPTPPLPRHPPPPPLAPSKPTQRPRRSMERRPSRRRP